MNLMGIPAARFGVCCLAVLLQTGGLRAQDVPPTDAGETAHADDAEVGTLDPIVVRGQRVAILQPATTYASLASALRYDPSVQLQPRGLPESQADVTVRGGLFENTGFRIGAINIIDPQTGHYAVQFPIDPEMLTAPELLTDTQHAVLGFNASVATVQYRPAGFGSGGSVTAGAGSDDLRFGVLRAASVAELADGREIGGRVSLAASRGDGSVPFGDHDFERYAAQVRLADDDSETHLLAGYHDTFFGWPGAYTGFASLPETDRTRMSLVLADHRRSNAAGWWEITAAWRRLEDDYDFDRRTTEAGVPGSFDHETRAAMLGMSAEHRFAGVDWLMNLQFTADRLVRSTDLTVGDFSSRSYLAFSLAPTFVWPLEDGRILSLTPGLRADWSNRDEDAVSPLLGIGLEIPGAGAMTRLGLDYARTTQVPGYTALKSPPAGLFGGNAALEREYAGTITAHVDHERGAWRWRGAIFRRHDRDLVDWTFTRGAPFARQANPVDIDVWGAEASVEWQSGSLWLLAAYAWLDKDADYGSATVDASYYALNFARQRATLAVAWRPARSFELRLDNAWRLAEENPLRGTGRRSLLSSLAGVWRPGFAAGVAAVFAVDNIGDDDFEEFPGTPARGRQWSVSIRYGW
ncbi:TonB-dependent receptor plug domain-containing protein [Elongatibacter sediminis]|uniref:TonB-dependent receptor n=1 Tax=Elongatibacter sediminis TaxID=3119006 RepID=A0AAW9RCH5_9GAMM